MIYGKFYSWYISMMKYATKKTWILWDLDTIPPEFWCLKVEKIPPIGPLEVTTRALGYGGTNQKAPQDLSQYLDHEDIPSLKLT